MSILIRDMEMPKSCGVCPFCVPEADEDNGDICVLCGQFPLIKQERSIECPLIPVPKHGRLIDADEFDERIRQAGGMCEEELTEDFKDGVQTVLAMLKTQTTIIPAEEGD